MHPYSRLPDSHFWRRSVEARPVADIDYDPEPKFVFRIENDLFATAGSCFAQHFGRALVDRGGHLLVGEQRHPMVPEGAGHGYGVFSARYGNLYTTRQLRELVQQATGLREPIFEFVQRPDGRWCDALRPRAVPDGFSSEADAMADRRYHLRRVRSVLSSCTVFVFTLGLTESWINKVAGYSYGICPGVIAGTFDPSVHEFKNMSFGECLDDLNTTFDIVHGINKNVKILLTVSPVMLVATAERRGVLQSSIASKSILRAAADECTRTLSYADYFPSYEIITGPQARGAYYEGNMREVGEEGVQFVMNMFFKSRIAKQATPTNNIKITNSEPAAVNTLDIIRSLQSDCDEAYLDKR